MALESANAIDEAKAAALEVLLQNARTGRSGLPRTAGWGYPEPYTRDLMISSLGILVSENAELTTALQKTLVALSAHQSALGLMPGLADDPTDLGASDTTPLFLLGLAVYRQLAADPGYLEATASRAMRWNQYQSPSDRALVAQQPTSDWRDEQWVLGFGLYVNALVHASLKLFGQDARAVALAQEINKAVIGGDGGPRGVREGLVLSRAPYYALWSYKIYCSKRFDLLGNSLAILCGIANRQRAEAIVDWVETACAALKERALLALDLAPNLFPFIESDDADWRARYNSFNKPGEYHNGGIWPFVSGFHVAALVATGRQRLAERKLAALTDLCRRSKNKGLAFGFNEWIRAQDGRACGEDWQLWSASMYLYAARCVETGTTPLFDSVRGRNW
jgi:hypothetical protein